MSIRVLIAASLIAVLAVPPWLLGPAIFGGGPTASAQGAPQVHPVFETALNRLPTGIPLAIRAPSSQVELLDGLVVVSATAGAEHWRHPGVPMYEVAFGRPGEGTSATFVGFVGADAFQRDRAPFDQTAPGCSPSAPYCAFPGVGGQLISESFYNVTVNGDPAVVQHITCCNGHSWTIEWYEAGGNASYGVSFQFQVADSIGAGRIDPGNVVHAQQLANLAASLISVQR